MAIDYYKKILVIPWSYVEYISSATSEPAFSGTYYYKTYVDELHEELRALRKALKEALQDFHLLLLHLLHHFQRNLLLR